jgi:hypothetical protein
MCIRRFRWHRVGSRTLLCELFYGDLIIIIIIIIINTSNNWSHWNSNEKLKEKFRSYTRKTFDRFTTKDSYTWNIIHNTKSTTV